jgi:hypothetical protein
VKNVHPKVAAVGLVGAVTTLAIAFLHGVVHFDPTPAEVAAGTTILTYLAGYIKTS